MPEKTTTVPSVLVEPKPFCTMALHATQNPTSVVHGVLMGSFEPEGVAVTKAVPICHEVPTKPLVENALALVTSVAAEEVVGWYTVPERFEETKPSPAALRIVANLAVGRKEPADDETLLQAFGKDFGQQWMDPIPKILMDNKAKGAAKQAFEQKVAVTDFVDHLEADASSSWLENAALDKLVVQ